jgi:L-alanine-DL-glutamate epimerase-like enolase superfamily enzyme
MKIDHIEIFKLNIPYTQALKIALGELKSAENIAIKITSTDGLVGWGESCPCPMITGDSQATNYQTAQQLAHLLKGKDPLAIEARMTEIKAFIVGESSIRSAVDMALYDLAAKAANMPLYQFLGGELRTARTDFTIGIQETIEETLEDAKKTIAAGFNAIKMKVGRPGLRDVDHVRAVRELVGPDIDIKIDSNQGWDFPTALANIQAMKPLNLEYSEQPIAAWDHDHLAQLRTKVDLPICVDESVFDDKDALKLIASGSADYLNIKLGKSGGIHTALKINAIAEAGAYKCMIGCFTESRLGLSAAAHLAMARPNIHFLDLDSAFYFREDPVIGGIRFDEKIGGLMHFDDAPGLGAEFAEKYLDEASRIIV